MANVNKYQRGKIYKIWSPSTGLTYYGSTTQRLVMRLGAHRRNMRNYKNGKYGFMASYTVLECPDHRIDLVEDCPCERKDQLHAREGFYIKNNDCVNKRVERRTQAEYREANREQIIAKAKEYREANKEKISAQNKKYNESNKEKIKAKKKEYHKANKEKIIAKAKEHYKANKELILTQRKQQKIKCVCGVEFRRDGKTRHEKSKKHTDYIEQQRLILQAVQEEEKEE